MKFTIPDIVSTGCEQINTSELWDNYYMTEEPKGEHRILDSRREFILDSIRLWGGDISEILDIGCGYGELFIFLEQHFKFKGTGIDICENTIQKNKVQLSQHEWILANIESIELPENKFDISFCGETVEHLDNPEILINKIAHATKPGGLIIITTPLDKTNSAWEHTFFFSRKSIVNLYEPYLLINYKLLERSQQCAAFIKR